MDSHICKPWPERKKRVGINRADHNSMHKDGTPVLIDGRKVDWDRTLRQASTVGRAGDSPERFLDGVANAMLNPMPSLRPLQQ